MVEISIIIASLIAYMAIGGFLGAIIYERTDDAVQGILVSALWPFAFAMQAGIGLLATAERWKEGSK